MRVGPALVVLASLLAPARASAEVPRGYALLRVGARGAASAMRDDAGRARSVTLQPNLGLSVYGGDWFLKLDLGGLLGSGLHALGAQMQRPLGAAEGEARAEHFSTALGRLEVGTHWPTGPGALAVGLLLDGTKVGLRSPSPEREWRAGGTGLDLGLTLHYAFPVLRGLRIDPMLAAGGGLLWGSTRRGGVWLRAEVQVFLQVRPHVSLHAGGGWTGFRYAGPEEVGALAGRAATFQLGVALHGLLGLGAEAL